MQYGAHMFLWTDRWSDAKLDLLDGAKAHGLDYVEIAIGDDVTFEPRLTRARAESLGLELVVSPGADWPMDCDLSGDDPAQRARGLEWHRGMVDLAAEVGAVAYTGAIYGHPGVVDVTGNPTDRYGWTAQALHALAEHAAQESVRLALEPMNRYRTHMVNTPEQVMRLIEMADHANLGVLLDTYHMVTEVRDYARAVRTCAERLWGVHACGNDRGVPGGGLVPWQQMANAVRRAGFDGHIGLESYNTSIDGFARSRGVFQDVCPDGDAFVRAGLAFLRRTFECIATREPDK